MSDKDPFSGDGFSRDPLSGEENASYREMRHKLSDAWGTVSGANDMRKGGARLAKVLGVVAAIGGGIAYLVKQGFFS